MSSAAPGVNPPRTQLENKSFYAIATMIALGIFATTLPQPQVLGRLPLTFLLKDKLHAQASDVAWFFLACGLAWYIKPIAGLLTDAFPIFGTRRRHYMMISAVLAALAWLGMLLLPLNFSALLWGAIIVNLFMVMASTVTGAFLVETGQSMATTGRFSSLRIFAQNVALTLNGYAGGLLASVAFLWVAGVNAALIFSLFPITYVFLKERPIAKANQQVFENAGKQLRTIGRSGILWVTILFVFLFYFAPGFSTLLTFRQADVLHFKKDYIGLLGSFSAGFGLLGAVVYGFLIKRWNIRTMLFLGIGCAAAGTLFYLFYSNRVNAAFIDSQNGFFFAIAEVGLMDLAARSTPPGCEGLAYSLILSVRNVAIFGADFLGAKVSDLYHVQFNTMVLVNAGTTAVVLILLPFLPRIIMQSRDARAAQKEAQNEYLPEGDAL